MSLNQKPIDVSVSVMQTSHHHGVRQILKRVCVIMLFILTGFSASGCVYWRLHQFREQLSAFPHNFRIEEGDAPVIIALNPILKPDDIGWLTGLPASRTDVIDEAVKEIYHYVKQYGNSGDPTGDFDILIRARFNPDQRLNEIEAPARFAPILTDSNFEEVFGPMRHGRIERRQHATGWSWEEHRVNIPTREEIRTFFGPPTLVEDLGAGEEWIFGYLLNGNEERRNPTPWDLFMRFRFEPEEERVIHAETFIGRIHLIVDLSGKQNHVTLRRR